VIGIARNQEKLNRALKFGADVVINSTDKDAGAISKEFRGICKERGLPGTGWKIFEVSGSKAGQEIALGLLSFTGKLVVVGFTLAKTEYAIGRLMALTRRSSERGDACPSTIPLFWTWYWAGRSTSRILWKSGQ